MIVFRLKSDCCCGRIFVCLGLWVEVLCVPLGFVFSLPFSVQPFYPAGHTGVRYSDGFYIPAMLWVSAWLCC